MWTIEDFKQIKNRYETSGLSIKDFCKNERITRSRFYYWQKRYRKFFKPGVSLVKAPVDKPSRLAHKELPGFIPVILSSGNDSGLKEKHKTSTVPSSPDSSYMEICYPNGNIARFQGEKDMELVKALIVLSCSYDV